MNDSKGIPETKPGRTPIDDLVDAARKDPTETGLDPLYRATFELPRWYFVGIGTFPNMEPFCGVVNGSGYVMAFSDSDRARFYAGQQNALAFGDRPSILSFPVREAVRMSVLQQRRRKVGGVLFDDGWGNWQFPFEALPGYLARYLPADGGAGSSGAASD